MEPLISEDPMAHTIHLVPSLAITQPIETIQYNCTNLDDAGTIETTTVNAPSPTKDHHLGAIQQTVTIGQHKNIEDDNWQTYRAQDTYSSSETSNCLINYSVEAIDTFDSRHTLGKGKHIKLCKGLFGMHIKRGRGRPRKFPLTTGGTKKKTGKIGTTNSHSNNIQDAQNCDRQVVPHNPALHNKQVALNILHDALGMGLSITCDEETALKHITEAMS